MAASRSAGCAAEFVNIGRYVVVASKSGPVETGPTILVATALIMSGENHVVQYKKPYKFRLMKYTSL